MTTIFEKIIQLSKVNPDINYCPFNNSEIVDALNVNTKELIGLYFSQQPTEYLDEIKGFSDLNFPVDSKTRAFIFIPCYNENTNLENIIKLYENQLYKDHIICFILNFPKRKDYSKDKIKFEEAILFLLDKQKENKNIHIIAKQFSDKSFGLGRARKYGLDYCLYQISKLPNNGIENTFIISNEGDTLSFDNDYLSSYNSLFEQDPYKLIQGRIEYPKFIQKSPLLNYYISVKELVHFGQGVNHQDMPHFGGLMPIGRNFAVHPKICVLSGGIDPSFKVGTDDDIKFGNDIRRYLGVSYKKTCDITIVTNPRREVFLVLDILTGNDNDAKQMYEQFHDTKFIYDLTLQDLQTKIAKILTFDNDKQHLCRLINQFFQWVHRTNTKNYFAENENFKEIQNKFDNHILGYWESENEFAILFKTLCNNNEKLVNTINETSLTVFNLYIKSCGLKFNKVSTQIDSSLIE